MKNRHDRSTVSDYVLFFSIRVRHVESGQRTVARHVWCGRRGGHFCEMRVWLSRPLGLWWEVTTPLPPPPRAPALRAHVCSPFLFFQLSPRPELDFRFVLSTDDQSFRPVSPPTKNFELFLSTPVFKRIADACAPVTAARAPINYR